MIEKEHNHNVLFFWGGREGGGHSTILCNPKLLYTRLFLVTHIAGCEVDLDATHKRSISFY